MRLDVHLVENNYYESRKKASDAIKEGCVSVGGRIASKPSEEYRGEEIKIIKTHLGYVGRGGLKLEKALEEFGVDPKSKICADIGSSTGGFTDVLLRRGAKKVYAVDSGRDQLHPSLRSDPRVVVMEGKNARYLERTEFGDGVDLIVLDVSFISQTLIHESAGKILKDGGEFVSLIKPQFECGREGLGKNGVVKDGKVREKTVDRVVFSAERSGFKHIGTIVSPVKGGDGNVEYLAYFIKTGGKDK